MRSVPDASIGPRRTVSAESFINNTHANSGTSPTQGAHCSANCRGEAGVYRAGVYGDSIQERDRLALYVKAVHVDVVIGADSRPAAEHSNSRSVNV